MSEPGAGAGLPHVVMKAAITLDGHTATRNGESKWITGEAARTEAHRMRAASDAILVGVGTVRADDPSLTVRHVPGPNPRRVVLDTHLRTPPDARVAATAREVPTLLVHGPGVTPAHKAPFMAAGVTLVEVPCARGRVALEPALRELAARGVGRLLVEGGPTVHGALLEAGLAQELALFVAPKILGDPEGLPLAAAGARGSLAEAFAVSGLTATPLGPDLLLRGAIGPRR